MAQGTKPLVFFTMVLENTLNIHHEFISRLRQRLQLNETHDVNSCDFIIAFFPIVSRTRTDIEAALQKIPDTDRPVVLVALYFTFDETYVVPNSSRYINRNNVFAVDVLCYEDLGLLRSLRNDQALKAVTDHLISMGGSPYSQLEPVRSRRPWIFYLFVFICIVFTVAVVIMIGFAVHLLNPEHGVNPTLPPEMTTTTLPPNTTTTIHS